MGRRNERREEEIIAAVLMGIGLLKSMAGQSDRARREAEREARHTQREAEREARHSRRDAERQPRGPVHRSGKGLGSIAMMVLMVGAFIVLGLFMSVLASIAALAQSPAGAMLCALPLAAVGFLIWAIARNGKSGSSTSGTDATQKAAGDQPFSWERIMGKGAGKETAPASPAAVPAATTPAPAPRSRTLAEEYPEKGMRPPSEYRQRAASYRRRIESLLKKRRPGPLAERIRGVLEKLKRWEERVGQLADRLVLFETDDLIQRDLREVPGHIDRLKRQIMLENDQDMHRQIGKTLGAYEEQLRQLRLLARVMRRTRLNLDDTLAAMGTVYSQVQVLNAMDIDAPAAARIDDEIGREVERLNDVMDALAEVYASSNGEGEARSADAGDGDNGEAGLDSRRSRLGRTAAG